MANPSVLTPIGFDTPQLQYSVTPQVAQSLQPDSTPDTTGLSILSEANKSFQQTNQAQSQSYQMQVQALDSINKAQVASAQAIGQAEQVNFQATAASGASNVRAWAGLIENVGGVIEKATKAAEAKRLAELKAELDRNQIQSTTELENLQVDWIEGGRLAKEGTSAYRRAVGTVLAARPLQADTISALTTKYYAPALDHAKQQDKLVFEAAQKTAEFNRDIEVSKVKMDLVTSTAALKQEAYLPPDVNAATIKTIKEKIAAIYARKDIDDLTKAQIVSAAFDPILKAKILGADSTAELGRLQAGHAAVANYITANAPRVMDGTLQQSEFNDNTNQIRISYGLPTQDNTAPDVNLQRTVKNLETNQSLDDLNKKGIISKLETMEGNELYAQSVGLQLFLNPTSLSLMKGTKPEMLDKNAKAGIEMAERANKFFGETTQRYQKEYATANEAILKIQQQDYKTAISLINKAGEDNTQNSLAASLRGLGLGMPASPPGQVGVTQEQLDFMTANSVAVQQSIKDSLKPTTDAYNAEAKVLAQMGFHADKAKSQAHLKVLDVKTKEYNQKLEALRLNRITQLTPQQPGQSPNFNGGSLGAQVPLMKRTFRGVANVAMPFPVDAAKAMSDAGGAGSGGFFGDYRSPTRNHDGVDFPVPVGTPVLSMVYGTVTEVQKNPGQGKSYGNAVAVKGDDGKEYFYAHLDSSHVRVGQRVGPGEKVGLSGESGAPGQPHLHMEISVGGKTIDPLQVLSTGNFGQQPRQVRTAGPTAGLPPGEVRVDPRAIPLGNGSFLLDGKVTKFAPDYSQSLAFKQKPVDVYSLQHLDMTEPMKHLDIKIAPGLTAVGYTPNGKITTASKPGDPAGYFTFRNKAGGILTQTAFLKKGATRIVDAVGFDGFGYTPPIKELVFSAPGVSKTAPPPTQTPQATHSSLVEVFAATHGDKARRNAPIIIEEFRKADLPDEIIAAALVNVVAESGFDEQIPGDSGNAIGLFQLNSGGAGAGMSVEHRRDPRNNTRGILADYGMAKMRAAYAAGERDIATLAALFSKEVERPGDEAGEMKARAASARKYFPHGLRGLGSQPRQQPQVPRQQNDGRIPIGGGKFLLNGKVISKVFTQDQPLQPSYASASRHDYSPVDDTDPLGYEQLVREPETLAEIHTIAKQANVPPQWIADVAALHGTSGIDGPEELDFIATKIRQRGEVKTPTDLVAAVTGDASQVRDLGIHTGRRYDSQFSRFERVTALTHTRVYKDCRLCSQLQAHSQFTPHKGEAA
jgi:murein DD-endopeptidase MepM/ murein hydrolase activator NlpD